MDLKEKIALAEKLAAEQKKVIEASYAKCVSKQDEMYDLVAAKIAKYRIDQIAIIDKKVADIKKEAEVINPKTIGE